MTGRRSPSGGPDFVSGALALFGLFLLLSPLFPVRAVGAQDPDPIELSSTWTDALSAFESDWSDLFTESPLPLSISNTLATGDRFAKRNLTERERFGLDFIISGTRFTDAEKAAAGGAGYYEIPVSIASLAFMLREPIGGAGANGWQTREPGVIETEDGAEIPNPTLSYDDPIRIRPSLLFTLYTGPGTTLAAQPEFREDNHPYMVAVDAQGTAPIGRVDPGALPKHLRAYFKQTSPAGYEAVLDALQIEESDLNPEDWPFLSKPTRSNNGSLFNALNQSSTPDGAPASAGMIGVFDTVNAYRAIADLEAAEARPIFRVAQIHNAAGSFVGPTKEAVLAGIEAGIHEGSDPRDLTFTEDAALVDPSLETAYPLTWLNWLIAPAEGLDPAAANAVATIARFLVTDGQAAIEASGVPALPARLVAHALAEADELVRSNCAKAKGKLSTRSDAGPFAPPGFELPAGTTIAWCDPKPATPAQTTTTSVPSTTAAPTTAPPTPTSAPPTAPPPSAQGGAAGRRRSPATTVDPGDGEPAAPASTTTEPPLDDSEPVATTLPLDRPLAERTQFDRVTTMGVGALTISGAAHRRRRRRS